MQRVCEGNDGSIIVLIGMGLKRKNTKEGGCIKNKMLDDHM